ncbi:Rieske (2Fe-2S) protein [Kineococcus rhizosphaerae]|uniref:Nitrite reductase (NADH) small subunit n=1 Tax=Kineococcus rhizosphaerae TaxID=559628 RepID=A0A2T0QZ82_9ACTN|nr:Rieske 2Fe-2S domain-containing protein [Kineococcus rhizosphaerae]PRY11814.1 nitrite reductase (NADH) small subunit [Kineococcus rhizosphaerae]
MSRPVCSVEDLPVGEGRAYVVDGEQVALFRHRSGKVSAVQAACPHAGGPLADGQIDETVVVCPLHLTAFDLTTGEAAGGEGSIAVHPCRVTADGLVEVSL